MENCPVKALAEISIQAFILGSAQLEIIGDVQRVSGGFSGGEEGAEWLQTDFVGDGADTSLEATQRAVASGKN